jgi:hypothetical protein
MPETLYLTCNIIDRYLAKRNVTRKRLQLVRRPLPRKGMLVCLSAGIPLC